MKLQQRVTVYNGWYPSTGILECHVPENQNLHIHCHNPKSHNFLMSFFCLSSQVWDSVLKQDMIATFQILTYSAFMMIFLFHGTLYRECSLSFSLSYLTNTGLTRRKYVMIPSMLVPVCCFPDIWYHITKAVAQDLLNKPRNEPLALSGACTCAIYSLFHSQNPVTSH
jgi:hypothetical protein